MVHEPLVPNVFCKPEESPCVDFAGLWRPNLGSPEALQGILQPLRNEGGCGELLQDGVSASDFEVKLEKNEVNKRQEVRTHHDDTEQIGSKQSQEPGSEHLMRSEQTLHAHFNGRKGEGED